MPNTSIHQTAIVDPSAVLGTDVTIGPFAVIGASVRLGDGSRVDSHVLLGHAEPREAPAYLTIGPGSTIRSHTVVYAGSSIGAGLQTGHGATIRAATNAGVGLRVGTNADIEGSCSIGDHVAIHSNVFVAPDARIGDFAWLFPGATLTNDPYPPSDISRGVRIGRFAAIGAGAILLPGVNVGADALVGAGSVVTADVADGEAVIGVPARSIGDAASIDLEGPGTPAYPWRRHFTHGYPPEIVARWQADQGG